MPEAGTQRMALDMMPGLVLREVPEADIAYGLRNQVVICPLGFRQHGARPPEHKATHHGLARRQKWVQHLQRSKTLLYTSLA